MSKYPVLYPSESKGDLVIEEMNSHHLIAAYNKLMRDRIEPELDPVVEAMREELDARGLDPQYKSGKPPAPPLGSEPAATTTEEDPW